MGLPKMEQEHIWLEGKFNVSQLNFVSKGIGSNGFRGVPAFALEEFLVSPEMADDLSSFSPEILPISSLPNEVS